MIFQPKPQSCIVLLLLWKQAIDFLKILVETPKFWPISKCTDPPINVADFIFELFSFILILNKLMYRLNISKANLKS